MSEFFEFVASWHWQTWMVVIGCPLVLFLSIFDLVRSIRKTNRELRERDDRTVEYLSPTDVRLALERDAVARGVDMSDKEIA
jgi:putative Mn2+ efflux pump MntP